MLWSKAKILWISLKSLECENFGSSSFKFLRLSWWPLRDSWFNQCMLLELQLYIGPLQNRQHFTNTSLLILALNFFSNLRHPIYSHCCTKNLFATIIPNCVLWKYVFTYCCCSTFLSLYTFLENCELYNYSLIMLLAHWGLCGTTIAFL